MALIDNLYEAAAHAGFLKSCVWQPSDGTPAQAQLVGFAAPDETLLDGLTLSTDYVMSYPAGVLVGLTVRETVAIDGQLFQVREIRAVGDGSEWRTKLSRL